MIITVGTTVLASRCTQMSNVGSCGVSACDGNHFNVRFGVEPATGPRMLCLAVRRALDKLKGECQSEEGACRGKSRPCGRSEVSVLCCNARGLGGA
jgi:hypothetical protein